MTPILSSLIHTVRSLTKGSGSAGQRRDEEGGIECCEMKCSIRRRGKFIWNQCTSETIPNEIAPTFYRAIPTRSIHESVIPFLVTSLSSCSLLPLPDSLIILSPCLPVTLPALLFQGAVVTSHWLTSHLLVAPQLCCAHPSDPALHSCSPLQRAAFHEWEN